MEILTDAAIQAVIAQGVWCILFIILFITTLKHNSEREQKYETLLEAQGKTLTEITHTLDTINTKIDTLNKEVGELEDGNRQ